MLINDLYRFPIRWSRVARTKHAVKFPSEEFAARFSASLSACGGTVPVQPAKRFFNGQPETIVNNIYMNVLLVLSSYITDLLLGDPRWFPHPVKAIGWLINFLESLLRKNQTKWLEQLKGVILVLVVVGASGLSVHLLIQYAVRLRPILGKIIWIFFAYTTLAAKDLYIHGRAVLKNLKAEKIEAARRKLSLMVGRDTRLLSKEQIIRAAVESISENTTDGIIAPLFYLFLGGPVLAMCYKAVNTLDSMVGYKNERYLHFGWASAKLDDVMNFIPARLSGFLIALAAFLLGKDGKSSFRIMRRDGRKHSSPNSAISEASMAGALGVRIGGPVVYQGQRFEHAFIGDARKPLEPGAIRHSLLLGFFASILMVAGGVLITWLF